MISDGKLDFGNGNVPNCRKFPQYQMSTYRRSSPALVVLGVQCSTIASHLFDVVVDGLHQLLSIRAEILPAEDELVTKPAQLGQIGCYGVGPRFFSALTHALLVPSPGGRSVLCLRMTASNRGAGRSQIIDS
ncbi:hypothetical protein [Bradyrhizobium sp. S3.9.2]|uniref:hypothetical protein n=1 Tax=unclassified Bradyrhizobium TaxID=2631580 RepID=UPI00339298A2